MYADAGEETGERGEGGKRREDGEGRDEREASDAGTKNMESGWERKQGIEASVIINE